MARLLSQRLRECTDLRATLECALTECRELTGAELGNVQVLDGKAGHLVIQAQHGFQEDFLTFFERVTPAHGSACGRALRSQTPIIVKAIIADPAFAPYREV